MVIHLISSPRTVSTSLMYSFDHRPDTIGVDEPFYAYYLRQTGKLHPGREAVLEEMSSDPKEIVALINKLSLSSEHVFVKNMAHHLIGLPVSLLDDYTHVLLIRHPRRIIASLSKVFAPLELIDIAVKEQWEWYQHLSDSSRPVVVVNSSEILKHPKQMLQKLCQTLQIPFLEDMLRWPAGPRPIDGSWAAYYYKNTHASTGFGSYQDKEVELSKEGEALLKIALPYYEKLAQNALTL